MASMRSRSQLIHSLHRVKAEHHTPPPAGAGELEVPKTNPAPPSAAAPGYSGRHSPAKMAGAAESQPARRPGTLPARRPARRGREHCLIGLSLSEDESAAL